MAGRVNNYMSPEEEADMDALCYYHDLEEYISEGNGRFFVGSNDKCGKCFFDEIDKLLPKLVKIHYSDEVFYRARIIECRTGSYKFGSGPFDAYSEEELAAPPPERCKDGRINPKGVSYLYLADSRRCALAEVRPTIASSVAVGEGKLHRDISVISFLSAGWDDIGLFEKSMVNLVGSLFSAPLNNQDLVEYIPSQAIAEFIKNAGYDGIEYGSAQYSGGTNLALFNPEDWSAYSAKTFDVTDIEYKTRRDRSLVELFGYDEEEL